jgi:hypothetical protein
MKSILRAGAMLLGIVLAVLACFSGSPEQVATMFCMCAVGMALTADDIADMVKSTLKELGRMKFQDISQELQDYEIFTKWFKKGKVIQETGIGIQKSIMHVLTTQARHVSFADVDVTSIIDLMTQMSVPWRHVQTTWSYFRQEMLMNKGDQRIFNVIEPRRKAALISLATELENKAWASPSSSSDTTDPLGIPHWIVKNSSTGFNGGAPSGWTTVGGINPSTITKWKNYTGTYPLTGGVTKAGLIKTMRTALRKCMWKSPVGVPDYRKGANRYRNYVNETLISQLEDIGESQNENLGRDIASVEGGDLTFRKHPIAWIPQLDGDTTNPWYMIDHSCFFVYVLKGDFLHETGPKMNADNHNAYDTFLEATYNYLCVDRRRNAVIYGV